MTSSEETQDGKPLFEWSVDTQTGIVSETKRNDETQVSVTTEKHIDPNSLSRDAARTSSSQQSQSSNTENMSEEEAQKIRNWEELDAQRDIAFKVMYFFIVFIIGTFGLLFAYF